MAPCLTCRGLTEQRGCRDGQGRPIDPPGPRPPVRQDVSFERAMRPCAAAAPYLCVFEVDELSAVSGKHLGFLLLPGGSSVVSTAGPLSVGGRGLHLPMPHRAGGSARQGLWVGSGPGSRLAEEGFREPASPRPCLADRMELTLGAPLVPEGSREVGGPESCPICPHP